MTFNQNERTCHDARSIPARSSEEEYRLLDHCAGVSLTDRTRSKAAAHLCATET